MINELSVKWYAPKRWLFARPKYKLLEGFTLADVKVPEGHVSDGTTIPWFFQWMLSTMGRYAPCAFVHDFLQKQNLPSKYSASKFYDAMLEQQVPKFLRNPFYTVVRLNDFIKGRY
jgi:hypothetical protein